MTLHQNLGYLFAAFAVTWVALFGYLLFVERLLAQTRRRLTWLEEDASARQRGEASEP
jgi:CcmD family protein